VELGSWPHAAGREVIGATHIFVLRLSLDSGGNGSPVARVRIEDIESGEVKHFSEIDAAIDQLRAWLLRLAEATPGGGQGEGPP
jgi:hypothetical protein